jgi:NADH-quinone oxidoreductase subunit M
LGTYITFPELLLWLPLVFGVICFLVKSENLAKRIALGGSLIVLVIAIWSLKYAGVEKYTDYTAVNYIWLKNIGSSFFLSMEGSGYVLCLLTAVCFPIIFLAIQNNSYKNAHVFYGLMLLAQCGITGVFVAKDALVFYMFWELALIPVYFLCSFWGGEKRIQSTFKFFVYTFVGSLIMLAGILYVYAHTLPRMYNDGSMVSHSFNWTSFTHATLTAKQQGWLFAAFFLAFAIKMPIFPFHTWQPDAYDQSPTATTMVLSGLMVKMGLFGVLKWLLPMFPIVSMQHANIVMLLSIAGIIYASCIAITQNNLKRLVAYSSIAHIGLMCAAIFCGNNLGIQGMVLQMFNHGVNIIGLWIVLDIIEKQTGVKNMDQLGGLAHTAPGLTIMLVIIAFANIALPLTNAFVGEFMMFAGLFKFNVWFTAAAGISIILSAVYTLKMVQRVFYGEKSVAATAVVDLTINQKLALAIVVALIFVFGVYPQPLIDLAKLAAR